VNFYCKQASIHCSVFGEVLIHNTSSASEGTQALHIYINRLIDWLIDWLVLSANFIKISNCIVSFNYYFQSNYTWIWYNITTLVILSILNSRLKNPFSWNFDKVGAKHQPINQSINRFIQICNACVPSLADDVLCIRLIDWLIGWCLAPTFSKFQLNGFFRRLFNIERITNVVILYHIHV
jgi:hypothetical protein